MKIVPLAPPDSHYLSSAVGWIELGNFTEAADDLTKVSPAFQKHPDVLQVYWQIAAHREDWEECQRIAEIAIKVAPRSEFGWIHLSYALHEMKRTTEARDNLLKVVDIFPQDSTMRYNLACYECQLGHLDRAKQWIDAAMQLGDANEIRRIMIDDPDLEPLRKMLGI